MSCIFMTFYFVIFKSIRPNIHPVMKFKLYHQRVFSDENKLSIPFLQRIHYLFKQHTFLHLISVRVVLKHRANRTTTAKKLLCCTVIHEVTQEKDKISNTEKSRNTHFVTEDNYRMNPVKKNQYKYVNKILTLFKKASLKQKGRNDIAHIFANVCIFIYDIRCFSSIISPELVHKLVHILDNLVIVFF